MFGLITTRKARKMADDAAEMAAVKCKREISEYFRYDLSVLLHMEWSDGKNPPRMIDRHVPLKDVVAGLVTLHPEMILRETVKQPVTFTFHERKETDSGD